MRRILSCALFAIITAAPLISAQTPKPGLSQLIELSRQGQPFQLIQAANSFLSDDKLPPVDRSVVLTYLANAYQQTGDIHQATANYEKALALLEQDGHHPVEYATALAAMGVLYADIGQADTAKHLLLRSIQLLEKDDNQHAKIAWLWNDLATIAADRESSHEAHKCMAHALAELRLTTDISPGETQAITTTQAKIAQIDGNFTTAIAQYRQALSLSQQAHGEQHPETAMLYVLLGDAYLAAGDFASSRQMVTRGLNLLEAGSNRQSRLYLTAQLVYSKVLEATGSPDEASRLRKEAQAGMKTNTQRTQGEISISALR